MKKIILTLAVFFMIQGISCAQTGISFIYINGSNNNDLKMKNWYENGVRRVHPQMKKQFETNELAKKNFLKNGEYYVEKEPCIFFWGDRSKADLSLVDNNLAILKGISPWAAYQVRSMLAHYLHDAIWVQKYHNMKPVVENLHEMVKAEINKGNKVVLFGYSAGSFVTYQYLLAKLPYINMSDFLNKIDASQDLRDFVAQNPMKNTCMDAIGDSKLAMLSAAEHIYVNTDKEAFKKNYMNLDRSTNNVCIDNNQVKGVVNFASPLVLFYSDIADPNFEITYYNRLMFKYIIENDLFWLTVNYREDPLGFPVSRNLTIEEIERNTHANIYPHMGFIYDLPNTWSKRTFIDAHTAYWSTEKNFSKAVVKGYEMGYRHQYDKEFQKRELAKLGHRHKSKSSL